MSSLMLGVLCARPKPWILSSLATFLRGHYRHRFSQQFPEFSDYSPRRRHSRECNTPCGGGVASIWHSILPSANDGDLKWPTIHHDLKKGDGSWNVAWDARPARWLHSADSAWLLFGVCACLTPLEAECDVVPVDEKADGCNSDGVGLDSVEGNERAVEYKVTGVLPDGRCLFRAIAHSVCMRKGEEAPDGNRQTELADELRAQVVDEFLKRRKETEWFIEGGDFDAYVKKIQDPYEWGGEPELLMASHVLKTPVLVFMMDKRSSRLVNIAKYGEEYQKDKENPINLLFHGYGHYDILETVTGQR